MRLPARFASSGAQLHSEREHLMIRYLLATTAVACAVTAVMAQSDPLSQRKALMKGNGEQLGALNKMVKGEEPFDRAKVDAAFAKFGEVSQKAPALFPEPPKAGEDTRALPKIWETKSDFEAKFADFRRVVDDNKDKAKTLDELKVTVSAVGKACGNCHEPYRKPAPR
jgi:cytochrome c556